MGGDFFIPAGNGEAGENETAKMRSHFYYELKAWKWKENDEKQENTQSNLSSRQDIINSYI